MCGFIVWVHVYASEKHLATFSFFIPISILAAARLPFWASFLCLLIYSLTFNHQFPSLDALA